MAGVTSFFFKFQFKNATRIENDQIHEETVYKITTMNKRDEMLKDQIYLLIRC